MGILLGRWDCEYCSKKGIPADVRHCPGCGNPVGQNVKYYLPAGSNDYVDPKDVPGGPDWQCTYCESYNRYEASICSNCGASRNEGKDYFQKQPKADPGDMETHHPYSHTSSGDIVSYKKSDHIQEAHARSGISLEPVEPWFKRAFAFPWLKWALIGISIIAVVIGIIALVMPKEKTLTVDNFSWERILYIDKYKTVSESDWSMPIGARLRYTRSEIRSYDHQLAGYKTETYTEQEIDHYETYVSGYRDLGNGYFEEIYDSRPVYKTVTKTREVPYYIDVPVYDTKYYYDIDKWVSDHTVVTDGFDKKPYWGQEPPPASSIPVVGDERVSSRTEHYYIVGTVIGTDKSKLYTIAYNDWLDLQEGNTIHCKVYITGKIVLLNVLSEDAQ